MSILDHVGINVTDFARSKAFYEQALAPLGIKPLMVFGTWAGFGRGAKPELWVGQGQASFQRPEQLQVITPIHVALLAESQAQVDAFYRAALEAGGKDNGAPGPRHEYHPGYYGAFVLDPDGHNVEAVIHDHKG